MFVQRGSIHLMCCVQPMEWNQNGRIEELRDGGRTRRSASRGCACHGDITWVSDFVQIAIELWAMLSNDEIISAPLASLE